MNTYSNYIEKALHPAFNVGDRVYVSQYGVLATVTHHEYDFRRKQYWYHVKFDKKVRATFDDCMIDTGCYGCFGLAPEFDSDGKPLCGPLYYRQLLFEFTMPHWPKKETEFSFDCGVDIKTTKHMDDTGRWRVEKIVDGKAYSHEMQTDDLCQLLASLHAKGMNINNQNK